VVKALTPLKGPGPAQDHAPTWARLIAAPAVQKFAVRTYLPAAQSLSSVIRILIAYGALVRKMRLAADLAHPTVAAPRHLLPMVAAHRYLPTPFSVKGSMSLLWYLF
jgi:hypothetical protein